MATGRVLQFDEARGYGFIAADDGGEDVFLHASVFEGDSAQLTAGARVEFQVMAGDRGRKAYAAHLLHHASLPEGPVVPSSADRPEPSPAAARPECGAIPGALSAAEFGREITELLLESAPDLTARQVLQLRQSLLQLAQKRGWASGSASSDPAGMPRP